MSQNFEGQTVLITGGGGGIGKAAAARFLDEGANVVLSGTRESVLEAARAELDPSGERVAIRPGEITGRAQAQDLVRFAIERFGAVDVLEQQLSHRGRTACEACDHRIDRVVAQLAKEGRFPVVERPLGIAGIEHAVELAVAHRTDRIQDR